MDQLVTGIQQVGIGVTNAHEAWKFYRKAFGTDVPVFDDEAQAKLMTLYTGGEVHTRQAVLAMNLSGGGGFEIWQYKSRIPQPANFKIELGDLGINAIKIKARDVERAYDNYRNKGIDSISLIKKDPSGSQVLWVKDPYQNLFQVVKGSSWFASNTQVTGGVCGVIIGVSDIDKAMPLYTRVLGFEEIVYDKTGHFEDFNDQYTYRRVLLRKPMREIGAFSRLLGHIDIELIQVLDRTPRKIFQDRYWGDLGFIHVCFDVVDMDTLKTRCEEIGYPFTVDSASSFDMGEAAGRFAYIEDPDGTWIEFVQTHRVPVLKKLGWYINLKNRKKPSPLPDWMLRAMSFNRVRE